VVLHGKENEAAEDVWGIGKAIGLQFDGDVHNRFSVLSRAGKRKRAPRVCEVGVRERSDEGGC
jgi:hypothetical protein